MQTKHNRQHSANKYMPETLFTELELTLSGFLSAVTYQHRYLMSQYYQLPLGDRMN